MLLNDDNSYPDCKRCGTCCQTSVLCMTEADFRTISRHIAEHDVEPIDYGSDRCCFQNPDRTCMIWEARPQVCRLHSCRASRQRILEENPSLNVDEDLWLVDLREAFVLGAMDAEDSTWGKWSADGQTPAYLAATRMASLSGRNVNSIQECLHLERGMRVLDVGCGSGEYCFKLGAHVEGVSFTGLDSDEGFVQFASMRADGRKGYPYEAPNLLNDYQFVCADGASMPFDDATFDAVVSHTYLTATPNWEKSISEMLRVCKPGGTVSSVTSLTDDFYGTGLVRLFPDPSRPGYPELVDRVDAVRARAFPEVDLTGGIAPRDVPAAFARAGFKNVYCLPLGHYFSLSDAQTSAEDCRRYIDLLQLIEEEQLSRLLSNPVARAQLPEDDWKRFAKLIEKHHAELVSLIGANDEWEWYGNASLLVVGTVPFAMD